MTSEPITDAEDNQRKIAELVQRLAKLPKPAEVEVRDDSDLPERG